MSSKKFLALLLSGLLMLTLIACDGTNPPSPGSESESGPEENAEDAISPGDIEGADWVSTSCGMKGYDIRPNNDGSPVSLGNGSFTFDKSMVIVPALGPLARSSVEVLYELDDLYISFSVLVGVDDSSEGGSVEFLLYADDYLVAKTRIMRRANICFYLRVIFLATLS